VFLGPERQRDGGQIIDQGGGVSIFSEIDSAQIVFAGVTGFDADIRELFRDINGQLRFGLFGAGGADNYPKFPLVKAKRT
jgi:hypothetical protein